MRSDTDLLRDLNVVIGEKENDGDVACFATLLAPAFSMRRANGTFHDRGEFLAGVGPGGGRSTEPPTVTLHGDTCAVVTCVVSTGSGTGIDRVHNVRAFVRGDSSDTWRLLSWANERMVVLS
jgi:hypothetical protein